MTNQASELYRLCKDVYRRTKWDDYCEYWSFGGEYTVDKDSMTSIETQTAIIPLYTTDYLLEKLSAITDHVSVQRSNKISIDASNDEKGNWYAHYWFKSRRVQVKSDTPLKALLKLTIALSEAGELNG